MQESREIFEKFIERIAGWEFFSDGFIEVVSSYTNSTYFSSDELPKIYDHVVKISQSKEEIHFGPAIRRDNLGFARSDRKNLLYIKCLFLDIDSPDKKMSGEERLSKSKGILDEFLDALKLYDLDPSYIICSGHGYHVYFLLRRIYSIPSPQWELMEEALIYLAKSDHQAKDPTRLLRLPFTFNYKEADNPREVEFIADTGTVWDEKDFDPIVQAYKATNSRTQNNPPKGSSRPLGFTPPCIQNLLEPTTSVNLGYRHLARVVVGTFGFHEGWDVEEVIQKVLHFTEDPKKSESDVRSIYKELDQDPQRYSVGCNEGSQLRSLVDAGVTVCNKDQCQLGKPHENKKVFTAYFDELVDLVVDDQGNLKFLVKEKGDLILKDEHKNSNGILIPPPRESIVWNLSRASEVIKWAAADNDHALFEDLTRYHASISELPHENYYKFQAIWGMNSYLFDKAEYSPMIWFYGIPERGKTRTGKGMTYVAWRGCHILTIKDAHLLRLAKDQKATLFIDVTDLSKALEKNGSQDIILNRYERGAKVPRVLYPERGPFLDTVWYDVYGPTITATNEPIDDILATRSVQIVMPETNRQFENDIKPDQGLVFRERLLGFRARWIDKDLPQAGKPCRGRLGDILRPICQIVKIACPDDTWILDFVKEVETTRKQGKVESIEAQVILGILEVQKVVKHGHLFNEDILQIINKDRPERFKMSPQKLGKITASLGFRKYTSGEKRGIYLDASLLTLLCEKYGILVKKDERKAFDWSKFMEGLPNVI